MKLRQEIDELQQKVYGVVEEKGKEFEHIKLEECKQVPAHYQRGSVE